MDDGSIQPGSYEEALLILKGHRVWRVSGHSEVTEIDCLVQLTCIGCGERIQISGPLHLFPMAALKTWEDK